MKPIEGVELTKLVQEAKNERVTELTKMTRTRIAYILGKHADAQGSILNLERQLAKAKERLAKEEAKLALLEKGDWDAIQEDEKKDGALNPNPV